MRTKRASKRRWGGSVVEAAVVLPIVLMVLMGILEYGRYIMTLQVLTNAAREGAHYALAHTEPFTLQSVTYGNATSDVINEVNRFSAGQKLSGQTVEVYASDIQGNSVGTWTDTAAGEPICVKISGTYNFMIPKLLSLPNSVPISVQSIMRSEGN